MPEVNSAISNAIWLRKCYIQSLAQQADSDDNKDEALKLWGENDAYNWIISLLDINDDKTQYEYIKMTNKIYDNAERYFKK